MLLIPDNVPATIQPRELDNRLRDIIDLYFAEQKIGEQQQSYRKRLINSFVKLNQLRESQLKMTVSSYASNNLKKQAQQLICDYCDIKLASTSKDDIDAALSTYAEYSTLALQADMRKVKTGTHSIQNVNLSFG